MLPKGVVAEVGLEDEVDFVVEVLRDSLEDEELTAICGEGVFERRWGVGGADDDGEVVRFGEGAHHEVEVPEVDGLEASDVDSEFFLEHAGVLLNDLCAAERVGCCGGL